MYSYKPGLPQSEDNFSFRYRYETFRSLLGKNSASLQLMADLEADLNFMRQSNLNIQNPVRRLVDETLLMSQELNILTGNQYEKLYDAVESIRKKIFLTFKESTPSITGMMAVLIKENESADSQLIGGKSAGLTVLKQSFPELIPPAFTITTEAYQLFVEENRLEDRIRMLVKDLDVIKDPDLFKSRLHTLCNLFLSAEVPGPICDLISQYASEIKVSDSQLWAVRSSAAGEDDLFTFAGQFDTELNVLESDLKQAYKKVLASRFTERAVRYRIHQGIREVETQMAVLFMPMIEPEFSGVIYTNDPLRPDSENMLINTVQGLAQDMVKGKKQADMFLLSREENPKILKTILAVDPESSNYVYSSHPLKSVLKEIGRISFQAAKLSGHEMDIEWAVQKDGRLWLLQGRQLHIKEDKDIRKRVRGKKIPDLEGGMTIFPGRAEGPAELIKDEQEPVLEQKGSIVIVEQALPQLASILPDIGALIVEKGNPAGHLATLARELSVPCLFRTGKGVWLFKQGDILSIDATRRKIYRGSRWPAVRKRVLSRIDSKKRRISGPLYKLILELNLANPYSSGFKPKNCRSVHDVIRFIHEMAVRSMFAFGDRQNRPWRRNVIPIDTRIPIKIKLLDLDGSVIKKGVKLEPALVESIPFQALWKGISDPEVIWQKRTIRTMGFMPADFEEQVMGGTKGPRRPRDTNYFIVAKDYLNFNARFIYHYALIDAVVGPWPENNYINFRFRGGGANEANRNRRADFLESVLRFSGFGVDKRGDLVTSWFRYNSQKNSEKALEMLGRLMACSRQLDMLLVNDEMVKRYIDQFLSGNFKAFA